MSIQNVILYILSVIPSFLVSSFCKKKSVRLLKWLAFSSDHRASFRLFHVLRFKNIFSRKSAFLVWRHDLKFLYLYLSPIATIMHKWMSCRKSLKTMNPKHPLKNERSWSFKAFHATNGIWAHWLTNHRVILGLCQMSSSRKPIGVQCLSSFPVALEASPSFWSALFEKKEQTLTIASFFPSYYKPHTEWSIF